jgi:hypothetical protein
LPPVPAAVIPLAKHVKQRTAVEQILLQFIVALL